MDILKLKHSLTLTLFCCLLSACWDHPHELEMQKTYERKMQQAKKIADPWERFIGLSADVDPNAWARAWPDETDDQAKWAAATYLALEEAIRKRDQRAFDYVGKGAYGTYASLRALRAEIPAQADDLERLKAECDKAGIAISREFLESLTRGAAAVKISACSDKVQADNEAVRRESVLAAAKSGSAK
ncbi:hypothetical protein RBA41_31205 [Massilia sp. CCM 9210]|uniref:hypothetical protein n=1 Tax=Massilia scottii TaxID=3057166 RepID=UPI00279689BB|nr:hypothetical protein [Massilia sp. CCM 9210]MDQ1817778.1 hypothetical protein [Massilia sp. CCM 9210]